MLLLYFIISNKMILFGYTNKKEDIMQLQINDDNVREILSQNIKNARLSSNLTQENLAEKTEISLNFLKDVEGARSGVSLVTLINLCNSLNVTPNELLKDFFADKYNKTEDLSQQISFLNDYQKDAVSSLVQFFKNNDMYNYPSES